AIELSEHGMNDNEGGPFGAVIVKDGEIIAQGNNEVTSKNDPTMQAEIVAIRKACEKLEDFNLSGCELYTTCEPCPMCLGAVYWSRLDGVFYANTKEDAAKIGFDDEFIYKELDLNKDKRKMPMEQLMHNEALEVFQKWEKKEDKIRY
ncbi:MAG: nucleoside deaminase, partial [Patescibacteria group bacterium]